MRRKEKRISVLVGTIILIGFKRCLITHNPCFQKIKKKIYHTSQRHDSQRPHGTQGLQTKISYLWTPTKGYMSQSTHRRYIS